MKTVELDNLEWLQKWYSAHCNGEWEHSYGIRIDTLDNPGWSLTIDLAGTELESRTMDRVRQEIEESDWLMCWLENSQFRGSGDPSKLDALIEKFRKWSEWTNR